MSIPIVLCLSGHDPTGGAGIQADIETIAGIGGHCCPVLSCATAQTTCGVNRVVPLPVDLILEQCSQIITEFDVAAIKLGLLPTADLIEALATWLATQSAPVFLDPILRAGSGGALCQRNQPGALRQWLLPRATLVAPNHLEALQLTESACVEDAARSLLQAGARQVLITGGHLPGDHLINRLYTREEASKEWSWPRLPGSFHGTGCTLTSAIATYAALGHALPAAVALGQQYTWNSLQAAQVAGRCQTIPHRR